MIVAMEGTLERRELDSAAIKVGSVSLRVHIPGSTLEQLGSVGDKVYLQTHLYLREDNVTLYGFASAEELGLFQNLISVSGVGPKAALSLLSSLTPEQLALAIVNGSVDILSQVPGIGKKIASRLVLELKGKLEKGWKRVAALPLAAESADIVAALISLGYSLKEATQAVSALPQSSELSLEDKVKLALQQLGRK